jgi:hypothetical protein
VKLGTKRPDALHEGRDADVGICCGVVPLVAVIRPRDDGFRHPPDQQPIRIGWRGVRGRMEGTLHIGGEVRTILELDASEVEAESGGSAKC